MKAVASVLIIGFSLVSTACASPRVVVDAERTASGPATGTDLAPWAYPVNPPAPAGAAGGGGGGGGGGGAAPQPTDVPLTLPGSERSFTRAELRDLFDVADWRPELHPPMPTVVSEGRRPDVRACGFCHQPNGLGRPENAGLAGLPASYIVQQMADYRNDLRVSSEPRMGPPRLMVTVAKAATDEEVLAAAEYFSSLRPPRWIRVVESATVPQTVLEGGMFVPVPGGGTEPLGQRIVEVPEDPARTALRDPASGYVAYVPVGSIARGRALATTGVGGGTIGCGSCHGPDLKGLGPVPGIAGRSPSYLGRQLNDFRTGARRGEWSPLMAGVVEQLTADEVIALAAYAASLEQ